MNKSSYLKMALPMAIASVLSLSGCSETDSFPETTDSLTDSDSTFNINMAGGNGPYGGSGGELDIYKYRIGHLKILKSQTADASFTPITSNGYMGTVPLIITEDTTIEALSIEDPRPAVGTPYIISSNPTIYLSTGSGFIGDEEPNGETPTGITINAGTTLTLSDNGSGDAFVALTNDLLNNGTLTTTNIPESTSRTNIELYVSSYIGSGTIDNAGQDAGQSGGSINIYADYSILNHGGINSSGANDDDVTTAGSGGSIYLQAHSRIENTAAINSSGGTSTNESHTGGNAAQLSLEASDDVLNSGDLFAQGGDGITAGGNANDVNVYSWSDGNIKNSGNIYSTGGNATTGSAGSGSYIGFYVENADLINNGNLYASGGSTTAEEGNGGSGGYIDFYDDDDDGITGDFYISGNIDVSGGNTATDGLGNGGSAGNIYIEIENEDASIAGSRKIILSGYTSINANGGDGVMGAGDGGNLNVNMEIDHDDAEYVPVAVFNSDVVNESNFNSQGGNIIENAEVESASAGRGGYFELEIDFDTEDFPVEVLDDSYTVTNTGDINLSGGTGSKGNSGQYDNQGGSFSIDSYMNASNSGIIISNGGDDSSTGGFTAGGRAGRVSIDSFLATASNTAAISINGGNAEYIGGDSRYVSLYGDSTNNSGDISAVGGNADATLEVSYGGDGGNITLSSPHADDTQTGSIVQTGGTGETVGTDGNLAVNGLCTGPNCNDESEEYFYFD